jgi:anaerobic selenocysteine-containing dehydrogenase
VTSTTTTRTYRTCPLCEATCGLAIDIADGDERAVRGVRGDEADPFSRGYLCPKAYGLKALHEDPDRLRAPMVRNATGELREASWEDAFAVALGRLGELKTRHGADSIAVYLGNPSAHSLDAMVYGQVLLRALGSKQRYSASSADQLPKMVTAALMFGGGLTVPVPDLDRTQRLLVLGANPLASNGSLMTAPDVKGRLDAIRARGGKIVVVDPRRTETAARADEHIAIRPGGDAAFLLAIVHVLFEEGLVRLGACDGRVHGLDEVRAVAARFAPERVAARTGVDAATIRRLAREHAAAESAACYGRIGTTCQEFGTLASWAVDLVNVLTGNLDRAGGAMFTTPAVMTGRWRRRSDARFGRFVSRVKGLPEMFGELPVATLADEIEVDDDKRVRGLITIAGNPLVSAPGAGRLAKAFASLEFRVAVDPYVNATTRLADVILPPPSPLERAHYDVALYQLAVRNVARFSTPTFAPTAGRLAEWEILLTLAKGMMGMAAAPLTMADDVVVRELVSRELADLTESGETAPIDAAGALKALGERRGPARVVDALLRLGPYGDGFGTRPDGLTLDKLMAEHPHGVDLGPLEPRLPGLLRTESKMIELAPQLVLDDVARLERALDVAPPEMVLIGRRDLRSNNSWMHNLTPLIKGPARCTLRVHPDDATRLGLVNGGGARVTSRAGEVVAPVEVSDELRPGVVSLPHGFGHDLPGVRMGVARAHAGVNVNIVSDEGFLDVPSGNAAFNGVPVTIAPA